MDQDPNHWLMELIPLAEEIKHGKGTPEKALRMSELVLLMHNHLFNGGTIPQAWFVPMISDIALGSPFSGTPFDDQDDSGVHEIPSQDDMDLSCFDDPLDTAITIPPKKNNDLDDLESDPFPVPATA